MKILRDSSEEEMLAWFLRAELDSSRNGKNLRWAMAEASVDENLIADTTRLSKKDHAKRLEVIRGYRQYYYDFLKKTEGIVLWSWADFTFDEYKKIKLTSHPWWMKLTDDTRSIDVAVKNIQTTKYDTSILGDFIGETKMAIEQGQVMAPQIVYDDPEQGSLRFIEGSGRAVAYMLAKNCPSSFNLIVGICDEK